MTLKTISRRFLLKCFSVGAAIGLTKPNQLKQDAEAPAVNFSSDWKNTNNRVWLGESFWANPMEDWRVIDGAAECLSAGSNRNIHLVTHQVTDGAKPFSMSVKIKQVESGQQDGGAGFRIGIRSDINEYRSNCFVQSGIVAGLVGKQLTLGRKKKTLDDTLEEFVLHLDAQPNGNETQLTLNLIGTTGDLIESVSQSVSAEEVLGNISIVNNFALKGKKAKGGSRFRFSEWSTSGEFSINEKHKFGPILWSMYSLSDSRGDDGFVLKISALTGPLGEKDNQEVELHVQSDDGWKSLGSAELDTDAWVATFRIPNWDETKETPYKLVYREKKLDGKTKDSEWTGIIKANPSDRPLRVGALTCQKDYGFPYEPVAENLIRLDPDMLYFSGDQLYENHGGFGLIRDPAEPAILNYLRKYYMHGWAFRDAMKDRPTLVLPDDHDVFQGNIWGEGGATMADKSKGASSKGGYREPARMVNVVHTTCCAHHPDFYDPSPSKQDISVYFGDMVYGGVSFAIIGDRQWKSGPERVETGSGRADHVLDKDFDCSVLDKPGLVLLGERQEKFLKEWSGDWKAHSMKVLLSQTVFAGVATHHGKFDGYLKADLDSGGWPQTARNNAINIIRDSMALHICGDQHLATVSQYGVDAQRDSNWVYCTPAIAAGYPRWWRPDDVEMPHANRPEHGIKNTGEYTDGLGNLIYVYGVGNPDVGTKKNRYELAHQKGSGFGLVTIDTDAKTYTLDAFRFSIDATDGKPSNQFPGWPLTIKQAENRGENVIE
jgi:hypothetical protein